MSDDGDDIYRDRADRMADALRLYARYRQDARKADEAFRATGEDAFRRSAEGHRASARAELHMWPDLPDLLKMIEPSQIAPIDSHSGATNR